MSFAVWAARRSWLPTRRGLAPRWCVSSIGWACRMRLTMRSYSRRCHPPHRREPVDRECVSHRAGTRFADLHRAERPVRAARDRRLRGVHRPVRRHERNAGQLSRQPGAHAGARPVHGLRQSGRRGRARRDAGTIARARSPTPTRPRAARCSIAASRMRRSTRRRSARPRRCAAVRHRRCRACLRSAIRCGPI